MNTNVIRLSGEWQLALDPDCRGFAENWWGRELAERIVLPGTLELAQIGTRPGQRTLKNLNLVREYAGVAWYRRRVNVPSEWRGKRLTLYLERCSWEGHAWLDGKYLGMRNSLVAPHIYDLGDEVTPGEHVLTVAMDNSNLRREVERESDEADYAHRDLTTGFRGDRKLNCGGHCLTPLSPWNGMIGRLELRAAGRVSLSAVNAFPDNDLRGATIEVTVNNPYRLTGEAQLSIRLNEEGECAPYLWHEARVHLSGTDEETFSISLSLPDGLARWDEWSGALHETRVTLTFGDDMDEALATFGLRSLRAEGDRLLLNGRAIFLRGTIEDCVFPITLSPPMEEGEWARIFAIAREYGFNHFRFHTFCPPDAAFRAADRAGILIQAELPGTSCPSNDEDPAVTMYLWAEMKAMIATYGNHPSFCFVSLGNEQFVEPRRPDFMARHHALLSQKVRWGQEHDSRRLYTCTTHPYTPNRIDDYFVSAWSREYWLDVAAHPQKSFREESGEKYFTAGIRWGGPDPINASVYCAHLPTANADYDEGLAGVDKPYICHEMGQWATYPNVNEIPKYRGNQRAGNYELIYENLERKGMLSLVPDFVRASGALTLLLYKDEIEKTMRSRRVTGYQLLQLNDFPGQGTSPVGLLDVFWDEKGLLMPEDMRRFNAPVVPLWRVEKFVWSAGETARGCLAVANYGKQDAIETEIICRAASDGNVFYETRLRANIPAGQVTDVGDLCVPLDGLTRAAKIAVTVSVPGLCAENGWEIWTYPENDEPRTDALVTNRWDDEAKNALANGRDVLLTTLQGPGVPGVFTTAFWNPQMKPQTGTNGLLILAEHPALHDFPTEGHTNWQWWDVVQTGRALNIDTLPVSPIIRVIDGFLHNRNLALLFEARVGQGRLLVLASDLTGDLRERPASRQLRRSLLHYMAAAGEDASALAPEQLDAFFSQV